MRYPYGMMQETDRRIVDVFARAVRRLAPAASIWVFGSRARGEADPESDLDLCVVVPGLTLELREAIRTLAWEVGFEHDRVLSTVVFSQANFEEGPMAASTLVANIRREGSLLRDPRASGDSTGRDIAP